jgi:hypothetical protein
VTGRKINGIELKTQKSTLMITLSSSKELKLSSGKKTAFSTNGASSTGSQHVEECKLTYSYLFVQSSSPNGSRTST